MYGYSVVLSINKVESNVEICPLIRTLHPCMNKLINLMFKIMDFLFH